MGRYAMPWFCCFSRHALHGDTELESRCRWVAGIYDVIYLMSCLSTERAIH
jgi:hypothetical protein